MLYPNACYNEMCYKSGMWKSQNLLLAHLQVNYNTVSHFSYAPPFQGPHFFMKMLGSNILYEDLLIDVLSVW